MQILWWGYHSYNFCYDFVCMAWGYLFPLFYPLAHAFNFLTILSFYHITNTVPSLSFGWMLIVFFQMHFLWLTFTNTQSESIYDSGWCARCCDHLPHVVFTSGYLSFWQAWQVLSSGQLSCRNYVKPGKTVPVLKDVSIQSSQNVRRTTQQSPSDIENKFSGHIPTHKDSSGTNAKFSSEPTKCMGTSFPFHPSEVDEAGKVARGQNEGYRSTVNSFHAQTTNETFGNHMAHTNQANGLSHACTDDDDILEVIYYFSWWHERENQMKINFHQNLILEVNLTRNHSGWDSQVISISMLNRESTQGLVSLLSFFI